MNNQYGCCQNMPQAKPIMACKRVCTTFQNQYVEQPIICPIECRTVKNIIYVPRYYPRYTQSCYQENGCQMENRC